MATVNDSVGLVWFRRDLRLNDNPAWAAATRAHRQVIALFVLETRLLDHASAIRRDQLLAHLRGLDDQLRDLGAGLVVRHGPAKEAVAGAVANSHAAAVWINADASRYAASRDQAVEESLSVPVHRCHGLTVHKPGTILTRKGSLSQVFTPFYRTWRSTELTPWPSAGAAQAVTIDGVELPAPSGPVRQSPGESAAWDRVVSWLESVDAYLETKDLPAISGTSELSADLKFGTVAARALVDVVGTQTPGREAFVRQLAWRDWWAHMLTVHPDLPDGAQKPRYDAIAWRDDEASFEKWCAGRTGYPIVDAGMRQLVTTGWMHNRVRMICASFLVKDLLIDWRKGERFFRYHLVDADVAQNAGNWQWVAGTGPDAAPYFRVFNPTTQSRKFDPDGAYIRRWVPELADVPSPAVHEPYDSTAPGGLRRAFGDYPPPMVDHRMARGRAIDAYKRAAG